MFQRPPPLTYTLSHSFLNRRLLYGGIYLCFSMKELAKSPWRERSRLQSERPCIMGKLIGGGDDE